MPTPPRRRWFRYSLRAMFVVVTLLAVWLGYHANWVRQRREIRSWLDAGPSPPLGTFDFSSDPRPEMPWSLKLFGGSRTVRTGLGKVDVVNVASNCEG